MWGWPISGPMKNGMLVNESKHRGLVLDVTETAWIFLAIKGHFRDFGMEIVKKLNFSRHISNVLEKINNQLNVIMRFRKLIRREILLKLYKG